MPFSVVPILSSPRIASAIASCAWCHGKIRWARLETCSRSHEIAAGLERVDLANSVGQVDHDAVADHRDDVVVEDAARHELQGVALAADDDRVAGVVAALVAHDVAVLLGQQVDDLGLALVAPLGADDDGDGHVPGSYRIRGFATSESATAERTRRQRRAWWRHAEQPLDGYRQSGWNAVMRRLDVGRRCPRPSGPRSVARGMADIFDPSCGRRSPR